MKCTPLGSFPAQPRAQAVGGTVNFTQIEYLKAVIEYGGVRKASAHLNITPQAISSSIQKLERELGCALFERNALELHPTSLCLHVAERANTILIIQQELKEMAKANSGGFPAEKHFRLYVPGLNGRGDLFDDEMYESFSVQNSAVHLDVWAQSSDSCEAALMLDLADSAVTFERDKNINIDYREIGLIPLVVLCSVDNHTVPHDAILPEQLSDSLIAMPINLSVCLRSFLRRSSFDITTLPLRNTGYGMDDQLEFIHDGGLILALENAPLAKAPNVRTVHFNQLQAPKIPLFFCNKRGEWTQLHQTMYWFLLDALQKMMR